MEQCGQRTMERVTMGDNWEEEKRRVIGERRESNIMSGQAFYERDEMRLCRK